ncbi:unnamed protein product [Ectocarpus fasciculatus]
MPAQAAEEDRLWKDLCHRRWRRVNVDVARPSRKCDGGGVGIGAHQAAYASLNGWRDPTNRLRRTILSTAPSDAETGRRFTRGAQAATPGGGHATNISGMDVGPCRVVVCSADFAWYYNVRQGSNPSRQWPQEPRDSTGGRTSMNGSGGGGQNGGGVAPESVVGSSSGATRSSRTLRGFQLPSSRVTEARFSEDGERCFFGTVSGHIFIHECGGDDNDTDGKRHRYSEAVEPWTPILALASPTGSPVAVRQVVARFEGGCPGGSRLGVLCRPPLVWQPNLEGSGGGCLFFVDTQAQAVTRQMNLGGGSLGAMAFPTMERGGAAVSMAPLSSEGMPFGSSGSGELFAIGFGKGTVAVFDARCHEDGGMVGGFITRHRWLTRLRSAGPLLMASYERTKNIETWDMRRLPSRPTHERPPGLPLPHLRAPPRLADLACPANSPDFWVEPHGLCVAVHGAPRHSQRFGAKHAFWPWPRQAGGVAAMVSTDPAAPARSVSGGGGGVWLPGTCVVVPGVVNDSDYRMRLSTGVKFTDTHMATVLDSSRVLVDEMVAMPRVARGPGDREGAEVTSLFLGA